VIAVENAHVTKTTDAIDAIIAMQAAEPGADRDLTADEQALADTILDAEDGYVVLRAEAGEEYEHPVWYLTDDETPDLADSSEHTSWPAGQTWRRVGADEPTEPAAKGTAQAAEDWPLRHEDITDADDAAGLARIELLDDPSGWCRYVPTWQPVAWVEAYAAAYRAEWEARCAQDA